MSALDAFMGGADLADIDAESLRAEVLEVCNEAAALVSTWDGACVLIASMAKQCSEMGAALVPGYFDDPYVRGMSVGEGYGYMRAQMMLSHLGNAMRMVGASRGE